MILDKIPIIWDIIDLANYCLDRYDDLTNSILLCWLEQREKSEVRQTVFRLKISSFLAFSTFAHGLGDVSKEHEIQLGNWHHGRVATNED